MKNHLLAHSVLKPESTNPSHDHDTKKIKTENPLQQVITTKLAIFIAEAHIPLSVCENSSFIDLMSTSSSTYKVPSRPVIRDVILREAEKVKQLIMLKTKQCEHPSYCADLWKSKARDYYVAVTLQGIDSNWNLFNLPIAFMPIYGSHTAESVGKLIANVLTPFLGPTFKPYAGVIDGGDIASVRYTAAALNTEIKDQTCICHQLNNLIKRIIGDYFEDIYLVEWRAFIKRIRQSKPFEDLWNECTTQLYGKPITLQKDTPTRWSATVMMLKKAFMTCLAVERMRIVTAGTEHKEYVPNWGVPTEPAWTILGQIVELFCPTAEAITMLEGEKYVTQSLILLQICALEKSNKRIKEKYPIDGNAQLHVIIEDLERCLNALWDELPLDTVIASILDPRTKWFPRIPANEIKEALSCMKKEFLLLVRDNDEMNMEIQDDQKTAINLLFEDLSETVRKLSPTQIWNAEINLYQNLPRAEGVSDPLDWWKAHTSQLPTLATLARLYLSIPASQASCERLFSISKNDIVENRTSLNPDLAGALLFLRKRKDILDLIQVKV